MHTWDVMPSTNYDHNWYGGIQIKSETQEIIASYQQQPPSLQHQQHPSSAMDSSSSPGTSPQSVDTDGGLYFDSTNRPLGFNPLTPPGYPNAILQTQSTHHLRNSHIISNNNSHPNSNTPCKIFPKIESSYNPQTTLTPSHTPPMDVTPPKSPKLSDETPEKDIESISDNYMDSCDEIRSMESDYEEDCIKPVSGKPGSNKPKKYKCKQCDHISVTKTTFWEHVKGHIKPEKMLKCPKCPFVTEYKHHLEYHLRNHDGSKPFQCPNCNYSCVNKSMLNSHLKSHSNIYQYRCTDCNYATKYCHSLKLHLRKYNHKPAMVLNQDGTPNPLPIIDVYGTRRGPKTRSTRQRQNQQLKLQQQQQQLHQQQQQQAAQAQQIEEPTQSTQIVTPKILPPHELEAQQQHQQQQQHHHQQQQQQHQVQQNQQQQIPNLISSMLPNSLANMLHAGGNVPSMFPYLNLNLHMLAVRQQQNLLSQLSPNIQESALHSSSQDLDDEIKRRNNINSSLGGNNTSNMLPMRTSALDLTQSEGSHKMYSELLHDDEDEEIDEEDDDEIMPTSTSSLIAGNITPTTPLISRGSGGGGSSGKNRRKGRAFKLEMIKDGSDSDDDSNKRNNCNSHNDNSGNNSNNHSNNNNNNECTEVNTKYSATPQTTQHQPLPLQKSVESVVVASKSYDCKFCDISFKDAVLYTIHMGYHGYNDVFKCNMCGEKCDDRIAFFLHIARNPHS